MPRLIAFLLALLLAPMIRPFRWSTLLFSWVVPVVPLVVWNGDIAATPPVAELFAVLSTPIRLELFPRHADFSVRTVGLAGLGALGVSVGSLLAMDSPAARERGGAWRG